MNIEFVARNYLLDDRIRQYAQDKLSKVVKFLEDPVEVRISLEQEKHRHIVDLHVAHRHGVLQATEETTDMFDAVNLAADKMERQARRSRQKAKDKKRRAAQRLNGQQWPLEVLDRASVRAGERPRIIEVTSVPIKPMAIEEAALRLDDSEYGFVVFRDDASDRISVLYRRKDGNFGLIAPEF